MDERRLDELLAAALESGDLPADATPSESEELRPLLESARLARTGAIQAKSEGTAAMPVARARFERYIEAQRTPARPVRRESPLAWLKGRPRLATVAGAAAVLVLVALIGTRVLFTGADTAQAEVLQPGDYAQVEGVVTGVEGEGDRRSVTLASAFGTVHVDLSADAAITVGGRTGELDAVTPGVEVAVAGDVGDSRRIAARAVAVGSGDAERPAARVVERLRKLDRALAGSVVSVSLPRDGSPARVVVQTESGERFLVPVDALSTERLLRLAKALGARVSVSAGADGAFALQVSGDDVPPDADRPRVPTVRGVITGRDMNVLTVRTPDGVVEVTVRPQTRILLAESGLLREAFLRGEGAAGHTVSVTGALQPATGRVIADVLVVGPRAER